MSMGSEKVQDWRMEKRSRQTEKNTTSQSRGENGNDKRGNLNSEAKSDIKGH